jgi:hypothetical protein
MMLCVVVELAADELDRMLERVAVRLSRAEPRGRVRSYVAGLTAGLERKNGWTLAEQAGELSPDRMQRLPGSTLGRPGGLRTARSACSWLMPRGMGTR